MSESEPEEKPFSAISAGRLLKAGPVLLLEVLLLIGPILLYGDAYRLPPFENISTQKLPNGSYEIRYDSQGSQHQYGGRAGNSWGFLGSLSNRVG